jgi:hypothetical protein
VLPPPLLPLLLPLLPDELDPGELRPFGGVEDPDVLLPLLVEPLGLLLLLSPEGVDDPEVDAYTIIVAVEL